MKKYLMIVTICSMALPVFAQESNRTEKGGFFEKRKRPPAARVPMKRNPQQKRGDMIGHHERKVRFMDKALDRIGVHQQEREQIAVLQQKHRKKMRTNLEKIRLARRELSELQNTNASEADLDAAIEKVTQAQREQLKILVRNRLAMERILGKEKYALFMKNARIEFEKHGRRGGDGLPPRPERKQPPVPQPSAKGEQPPAPSDV